MSDAYAPFQQRAMEEVRRQTDAYLRQHGIEITVIDDSDGVGWAAVATRVDEIYMHGVHCVVKNVLGKKGAYQIRRLNILDHGSKWSLQIGDDRIDLTTLPQFEPELSKLKGHFHASGFVHLQHCDIGMNKALITALARIFGVSVYAGTGAHNPLYRINYGEYVRADPNGRVTPAERPGVHVRYLGDTGGWEPAPGPREPRMTRVRFVPREAGR